MADIGRRARPLRRAGRRRISRRGHCLDFLGRTLNILERQLALVRRQLLRLLAVSDTLRLTHQTFETVDPLRLRLVAVRQRFILAREIGLLFRQRLVSARIVSSAAIACTAAARCSGVRVPRSISARKAMAPLWCRSAQTTARKQPPSHSVSAGGRTDSARTHRQPSPANNASNWAWLRVMTQSRIVGVRRDKQDETLIQIVALYPTK